MIRGDRLQRGMRRRSDRDRRRRSRRSNCKMKRTANLRSAIRILQLLHRGLLSQERTNNSKLIMVRVKRRTSNSKTKTNQPSNLSPMKTPITTTTLMIPWIPETTWALYKSKSSTICSPIMWMCPAHSPCWTWGTFRHRLGIGRMMTILRICQMET